MLKTQKPLSWFLLAFLAEQGRWYSTDFDGERYWFPSFAKATDGHSWRHNRVAGAGIEPASGGSFTPTVSGRNGLYHNPVGTLPL